VNIYSEREIHRDAQQRRAESGDSLAVDFVRGHVKLSTKIAYTCCQCYQSITEKRHKAVSKLGRPASNHTCIVLRGKDD
jgi:hypothetical protein